MAFIDKRLPDCIAFGARFGPEYQTNVVVVNSGHESRNINWAKARLVCNIGYQNKPEADTQALIAWFRSVKGRAHSFRMRDWSDYKADAANGRLRPLAAANSYQLCKLYDIDGLGSPSETRDINKPTGGPKFYDALGGLILSGTYTLDTATGVLVTTDPMPAYWVGEFDVPVRFDTDKLELDVSDRSSEGLVYSWSSIPLIEVRE